MSSDFSTAELSATSLRVNRRTTAPRAGTSSTSPSPVSSRLCAERSARTEAAGAATVMVMPPYHGATIRVPELGIFDLFRAVSDAIRIPVMIQDAPVSGTVLSAPFLARMAREIAQVSYFKIEVPFAAAKLRELLALGGDAIEGPWDGRRRSS